jgi:hypothetical protein
MKLKRDEFKTLLKECILELVQEGKLFQQQVNNNNHTQSMNSGIASLPESSGGNNSNGGSEYSSSVTPNTRLNEAVKITANILSKGDKRAASMFEALAADTAMNTLQKQLSHEMGMGGMDLGMPATPEEKYIDQTQMDLFEANQKWAQIAFGRKSS